MDNAVNELKTAILRLQAILENLSNMYRETQANAQIVSNMMKNPHCILTEAIETLEDSTKKLRLIVDLAKPACSEFTFL